MQTDEGKSSLPLATRVQPGSRWLFATLVSTACIGGILVAAMTIACLRRHAHRLAAKKLGLGPDGGGFTHQEYQVRLRPPAGDGESHYLETRRRGSDAEGSWEIQLDPEWKSGRLG